MATYHTYIQYVRTANYVRMYIYSTVDVYEHLLDGIYLLYLLYSSIIRYVLRVRLQVGFHGCGHYAVSARCETIQIVASVPSICTVWENRIILGSYNP